MAVPRIIGSVSAIVGALVLMTGTMFHPLGADPGDHLAAFTEYATDDGWVASHLCQFVGVALMFIGLVAVYDTLREGSVAGIDGNALKAMVDLWTSSVEEHKQAAFIAALAVRQIEVGAACFMANLIGATVVLFGAAAVKSELYPRWLGWLGIGGGAGTITGGLLIAFTGFSVIAMNVAMPFNLILVIWMIAIGVHMWRHA